jgi:hypothetical protein
MWSVICGLGWKPNLWSMPICQVPFMNHVLRPLYIGGGVSDWSINGPVIELSPLHFPQWVSFTPFEREASHMSSSWCLGFPGTCSRGSSWCFAVYSHVIIQIWFNGKCYEHSMNVLAFHLFSFVGLAFRIISPWFVFWSLLKILKLISVSNCSFWLLSQRQICYSELKFGWDYYINTSPCK